MSADEVAAIAPDIREVIAGGMPWFATFEVNGAPHKWVEFSAGGLLLNAAYPSEQDPTTIDLFANFDVDGWQPNLFVRGTLRHQSGRDYAGQLARFIDRYFTEILDAGDQYDVASQLARHAEG